MRVAFVVGHFPSLSETFVMDQVSGLIDRGVDVDIYALRHPRQATQHPDVARYDLLSRTTHATEWTGSNWSRRRVVLRLAARALRRTGVSRERMGRGLRDARLDANIALGFAEVLGRKPERYDIIHCHFGPHGILGAAMRHVGMLEGKIVTTFHGYDMSRAIEDSGPSVYDRLFRNGDLFLPISEFWRRRLIELGCEPSRTDVHHMGVDCRDFTYRPRALPADGDLRLLSVARFVEKKGLEYAIRAVARLAASRPNIRYTIIGDGPLRPELSALIRSLGAERQIHLAGTKPRNDVIAMMGRAHVLLAPSVTAASGDQEGIPVVLMESMATGLPVVSTHHTGIPELVTDGVSGLLAPERDVDMLATKIETLVTQPSLYARVAAAARARVEQDFDVRKLNEQLLARFRRLAG